MADTAISYGTTIWLADLAAAGWTLTVVEQHTTPHRVTLHLVEDDFEPMELVAPDLHRVGVLARKGGDGVFVSCHNEEEARALLGRVLNEEEE
jgi:hypothetical protein